MTTNIPNLTSTPTGFICYEMEPSGDGQWRTHIVNAPQAWLDNKSGNWLAGTALSARTVEQGGEHQLIIFRSDDPTGQALTLYSGSYENAKAVSKLFFDMWLQANVGQQAPQASMASAAVVNPAYMATSSSKNEVSSNRKKNSFVALSFAAILGLIGAASWAITSSSNKEDRPALDLSALQIDELSRIESNPMAIGLIQDEMMEAVKAGQKIAMERQGPITEEHIATLKAMGLNPGTSMSSAANCLSNF